MNENHSQFLDRKYKSDNWKSWPPEKFLALVAHELTGPAALIAGYIAILADENARENHMQALEAISNSIEIIEELREGIIEYISKQQNPDT